MIKSRRIAALAFAILPSASFAQVPPAPGSQVVPSIAPPTQAVLRAQTPVQLRLGEELTTKKKAVRVGQRFHLEVAEPVSVNGVVVVPVGTPATGEVTEVRNKGMWGKSGYINARVVSMRVGDRSIRLTGTFDDKGITGTGGVVAAVATIPLLGFVTTGTSAFIPMGMQVKAFVDEDVPLAFSASSIAPMAVTAPTPMAAPSPAAVAVPATVGVLPR
jgi:hypothetical protein